MVAEESKKEAKYFALGHRKDALRTSPAFAKRTCRRHKGVEMAVRRSFPECEPRQQLEIHPSHLRAVSIVMMEFGERQHKLFTPNLH